MATKKKDKREQHHAEAQAPQAEGGPPPKMKTKEYEREMRVLHGELVAMQEWVKATGAKICIVFEGRDTAGKGGTIKRITERVSPRVFRVVAPAGPDRAREVADVHSAVHRPLPGRRRSGDLRPQLVQPGGRRAGDGLLHAGGGVSGPDAENPTDMTCPGGDGGSRVTRNGRH